MGDEPIDPRESEARGRARHGTVGADPKTIKLARKLRKEMSLPEVLLWRELKGKPLGMKFRNQFGLLGYVADFACVEVRLLIEVDGIAHDMGDRQQRDEQRSAELEFHGWQVIRIAAKDVLKDYREVAESIVTYAVSLKNPPRNGEVAPRSGDGGVDCSPQTQCMDESTRPLRPSGAPPRSGEDFL